MISEDQVKRERLKAVFDLLKVNLANLDPDLAFDLEMLAADAGYGPVLAEMVTCAWRFGIQEELQRFDHVIYQVPPAIQQAFDATVEAEAALKKLPQPNV